jgi:acetylornithine deacetylase
MVQYFEEINNWLEKNKDEIASTLSELIKIKTENLPPKGNEKPGQEYLYNFTSKFIDSKNLDLFEIEQIEGLREHPQFFPTMAGMVKEYEDRPDLVAKLPGKKGDRSLLFSGHMDTMPAGKEDWEVFSDPVSGKIKDGKMYGRGSLDMKSGTLSGFYALKCIHDLGIELKGDLYAESVVDEENGGVNGTIAARLRNPDIDFAILSEPTGLVAGIETIGGSDWIAKVAEEGPGGIGTDIELINPIYKLARVARALEKYDKEELPKEKPPKTYRSDMKLRLLTYQFASGGQTYLESGAVPKEGHIYFWLETFAYMKEGEIREKFKNFMEKELKGIKGKMPEFGTVIRFMKGHRTDTSHPAMVSIRNAYKDLGLKYEQRGLGLAMDAYGFKEASNTDVVVIGPKGANPHGTDEYVEMDSVYNLIKMMALAAVDYCG